MINRITTFLIAHASYLKWGSKRLANKFNCSERTINKIKRQLVDVKKTYLASL